jgi:hypothetical protein
LNSFETCIEIRHGTSTKYKKNQKDQSKFAVKDYDRRSPKHETDYTLQKITKKVETLEAMLNIKAGSLSATQKEKKKYWYFRVLALKLEHKNQKAQT